MTLYETKMGVLKYDSVTRKVTPCTAKGKLSLKWIEDEKHLTWTSDDQATSDLDLIVFAGDAKFDNYKNNIFILSFQTYEDKYFFWLQVNRKLFRKKELNQKMYKRKYKIF